MRSIAVFGIGVAALSGAALTQAGRAADLSAAYPPPPVYSEPDPQYEFGTGWYLRGDASFGPEDHPTLSTAGFDNSKSDWGYAFGGGVGYKFNSFLRADVTGDYLDKFSYSVLVPGTNITARAGLQRWDAMANGYIDLGTWYGFSPYVGGGIGVGIFDPSVSFSAFNPATGTTTLTRVTVADTTRLAWAAMAGVSYAVDPNTVVDLGYRHLDLGRFATTVAGYTISKNFTTDEVRLGVRYMIY
jgi:opacity protein-like surface antigen